MSAFTIEELQTQLESRVIEETAARPRIGYAEIAITDAEQPFLARWIFVNEEQGWRTSENYVSLKDAVHAIALLPGGITWLGSYMPRLVDERSEVSATDSLGVSTVIADDMNPE